MPNRAVSVLFLGIIFVLGLSASPGGCGGSEKESKSTATASTQGTDQPMAPTDSTPSTPPQTGTTPPDPATPASQPLPPPKPPKATDVLLKVTNAVTTSMGAGGGSLVGGNTARGASLEPLPGAPPRFLGAPPSRYPMSLEPSCSEGASPLDAAGKYIPDLDPRYASGLFYCVLKQPTPGPEGVLGPLAESRGFVCLVEKTITDLAYDGKARTVTIPGADPDCLPDLLVRDINELTKGAPFQATVTASSPPAYGRKEAWSRSLQITINLGGEAIDVLFLFKDGEGFVAGAQQGIMNSEPQSVFTFYLDMNQGILRYEQKDQNYDRAQPDDTVQSAYNRHTRVLIRGAVNAEGVFSSLTDYQGAVGNLYKHKVGDSDNLHTIKGNPTAGFKAYAYLGSLSAGDPLEKFFDLSKHKEAASCSGAGNCAGNAGIRVLKVEDLDFIPNPKGPRFTTADAWFKNLAPLTFSEVTPADSQP